VNIAILSVDGGGVRGIVPAVLLEEIEARLRAQGRCRYLHEVFHLAAGTSTGALIALALTIPSAPSAEAADRPAVRSATDLVELYRNLGTAIFPGSARTLRGRLRGTLRSKYTDGELVRILRRLFGQRTLRDAFTDLLIPSYDTESRVPRFFEKRPSLGGWEEAADFYAWEAARAATAAPTYFTPARIRGLSASGRGYSLIDGGVFANNPGLCAYAAARRLYPQARRFTIVSLGTGNAERSYRYEQMRAWGSLDWVSPRKGLPLIDMMLDGQSDQACGLLAALPEVRLHRLNFPLEPGRAALDEGDNLEYLEQRAREWARQQRGALDRLCLELRARQAPGTASRRTAVEAIPGARSAA
jgi:patatin-like phospholipase/acyl hydrolase